MSRLEGMMRLRMRRLARAAERMVMSWRGLGMEMSILRVGGHRGPLVRVVSPGGLGG